MVLRGSPGTMSSQTFRKLACFQKSVSNASACAMLSSRSGRLVPRLAKFVIWYNQFAGLYNQEAAAEIKMTTLKLPNLEDVVAIDIHTHAEEPCGMHADDGYDDFQAQMADYFKSPNKHPPPVPEPAAYYRAKKIAAVFSRVDAERETGFRRYSNYEMLEVAAENSDVLIPFVSIDPHKGKLGVREARKLIEEFGVKGFKFHPTMQGFYPT